MTYLVVALTGSTVKKWPWSQVALVEYMVYATARFCPQFTNNFQQCLKTSNVLKFKHVCAIYIYIVTNTLVINAHRSRDKCLQLQDKCLGLQILFHILLFKPVLETPPLYVYTLKNPQMFGGNVVN